MCRRGDGMSMLGSIRTEVRHRRWTKRRDGFNTSPKLQREIGILVKPGSLAGALG